MNKKQVEYWKFQVKDPRGFTQPVKVEWTEANNLAQAKKIAKQFGEIQSHITIYKKEVLFSRNSAL